MRRVAVVVLALLAACGSGSAISDLPDSSAPNQSVGQAESEVSFADVRREGCTSTTTTKVVSESVTATADGVEFSTSSPLQLELEDAIRVEVSVDNTTDQAKTVELSGLEFDWVTPPPDPSRRWYMQLFQMNSNRTEIAPGATTTFAWHIDPDGDLDERGEQPIMRPTFRVGAETASLDIRITSANVFGDLERMGLGADAVVYGIVTDTAGATVANAEVTAYVFSLKERAAQTRTDAQGRFALCVPSSDTYENRVGNRTSAYQLATYLSVRTEGGYQFAALDVAGDSENRLDVKLDSAASRELALISELRLPTNHGWFWIRETPDGFAAVEGRHPPELRKSGSLALVDADGGLVLQAT
ncbi:MAG: carboxypeptidase-like regulatory domain-containing protein, partial [Ilumatobacteraceae bacterium]